MTQVLIIIAAAATIAGFLGVILTWFIAFKKLQDGEKRRNTYFVMGGFAALLVVCKMILNYIGVV